MQCYAYLVTVSFHCLITTSKHVFKTQTTLEQNLFRRIKLFELPNLESADLNLEVCAFKFLIVLLLCYNILVYFNYSSLPVAIALYVYILLSISIEKLLYSIYSWYCQANPSSIIFLNISIWFANNNRKNCQVWLPLVLLNYRYKFFSFLRDHVIKRLRDLMV